MNTLRISVALAASLFAVTLAGTSRAGDDDQVKSEDDDKAMTESTSTSTTTTTTTSQPLTTTAPPADTQPPTVVQPASPPPTVIVQPPPVSTTTTTAAPYQAGPTADYYERETTIRPNRPLLATGIGIFAVGYGASAVTAAVSDRDADKNLFIPVVGPWLDLADRDCDRNPCHGNEDLNKAMIITSGVVQGAGVLIGVGSLFIPEKVETKRVAVQPKLRFTPLSLGRGAGFGAVGTF
jgi:hypothetical protein